MIVLKNDNYSQGDRFVLMSRKGNTYEVKLYQLNNGADTSQGFDEANYTCVSEQVFDVSKVFKANAIFDMMLDKKGQLTPLIDVTAVHTSRDGYTPLRTFYNATATAVLALYFADTYSDNLIAAFLPTKTAEGYELRDFHETFPELIRLKYPGSAKVFNILKGKRDLLYALDPNISLASIEAQLDILNQLVFLMLDSLPEIKKQVAGHMQGYADFRKCFDEANVMKVKAIDKCIDEITAVKTKVRQLQTAYYAIKAQNQ